MKVYKMEVFGHLEEKEVIRADDKWIYPKDNDRQKKFLRSTHSYTYYDTPQECISAYKAKLEKQLLDAKSMQAVATVRLRLFNEMYSQAMDLKSPQI
jgi:hypothetical protein